jgi:hypothetical protein
MFLANVQSFYSKYAEFWPKELTDQLELSVDSPEHPIFHPEKTLDAHIDEVVRRALSRPEPELHFAAILHDITKSGWCPPLWSGRIGSMKTLPEGEYWQNFEHPKQAVEFSKLPAIQDWMVRHNVDIDIVTTIVDNHMKMKNYLAGAKGEVGGMSEKKCKAFKDSFPEKVWEMMYFFSTVCDNMQINFSYHTK